MDVTEARGTRIPNLDDALERARTYPTITPADTAVLAGQSEATIRAAIARGEIEHIRLGRNIRVLSAPLRRQLGIE